MRNDTPIHNATRPEQHVAVLASAGTGKTYLLITRLLRLLLGGAQPDAILALTFTRKAAAEMQTRLNERLLALAHADEAQLDRLLAELGLQPSVDLRARAARLYEELLLGLHAPRITTFHAFCQELLRRFPLEAEVSPGFELTETSAELMAQAWAALFAAATAQPDGPLAGQLDALLDEFTSIEQLRSALFAFLDQRSEWWAYTENFPDPMAAAEARLAAHFRVDPDADLVTPFFNDLNRQALQDFAALLRRHANKTNLRHADSIDAALHTAAAMTERLAGVKAAFLTQDGEPRVRKSSKEAVKHIGAENIDRFLALHERLCTQLISLSADLKRQNNYRVNRHWYQVGSALLAGFQRIKREQRLLDFADLEWHSYRLLTQSNHAHWVQYKLDQRIEHLLIDEFQDTNPTQWRLLYPLLEELTAGDPERVRSVFLVGDSKQSIYGFRRAEPRLLMTASDWLGARGGLRLPLDASWRSAPAIIEAVNRVFTQPPCKDLIADFPTHTTHRDELWGRVEILPLAEIGGDASAPAEGLRNPLLQARLIDEEQRHDQEGRQIAARIQALLTQQLVVGSGTDAHVIDYDDILILLRTRTHVNAYERALREAGIPYLGADRGTLLSCLEVRDLLALLDTLIAPFNNLALAQVLRSPIFSASDHDLVFLAGHGEWWSRLQAGNDAPTCPATLQRAWHWLTHWRELAGQLPVHDLLDRIYSEGNVPARYESAFPPALQTRVRANLARLIELALEIDSGRYPSLAHFLARLSALRGNTQEAPDEGRSTHTARVTLMTIHAAKGLEAPVVFLADTASGGNTTGPRALIDWPPDAPRPEYFLLAGNKDSIDDATQTIVDRLAVAQARETANLLYVALTRARQMLVISAIPDKRKGNAGGWYGDLRNALADRMQTGEDGTLFLQSGASAAPLIPPQTPEFPADTAIDPRLAQRLDLSTLHAQGRMIAPSADPDTPVPARLPNTDEDGRLRGRVLHRYLQLLSEAPDRDQQLTCRRIAAEFDLAHTDARLLSWWNEAAALVANPAWHDWLTPTHSEDIHNEVEVLFGDGPHTVHGILDRVLVRAHEVIVIDYKTHQGANRATLPQLAAGYRRQMHYYRRGAELLWPGKPVRSLLLFTACSLAYDLDRDCVLDGNA